MCVRAERYPSFKRVSTLAADVPPGEVGHFALTLLAGEPGDFVQTFALVEDGVTWFSDAPKGGGPADDFLAVHVLVGSGEGGVGGSGGGVSGPGADRGGCSCDLAAASGSSSGAWLGAAALSLLAGRRRRRGLSLGN